MRCRTTERLDVEEPGTGRKDNDTRHAIWGRHISNITVRHQGREGGRGGGEMREWKRRIRSPFTFIPSFTEQERKEKNRSFFHSEINFDGEEEKKKGALVGWSLSSECECGRSLSLFLLKRSVDGDDDSALAPPFLSLPLEPQRHTSFMFMPLMPVPPQPKAALVCCVMMTVESQSQRHTRKQFHCRLQFPVICLSLRSPNPS